MRILAFLKRAKDEWYTNDNVPLTPQAIDEMLHKAYGGAGLNVLVTGQALKAEATGWIVGVDDENPNLYHWFVAYKDTPFGKKLIFNGHDGEQESKSELKLAMSHCFSDAAKSFYAEASHAWESILSRWGVPKVPLDQAEQVLKGKKLMPVDGDPYAYERVLGGQPVRKVMFGHPKVSSYVAEAVESWLGWR